MVQEDILRFGPKLPKGFVSPVSAPAGPHPGVAGEPPPNLTEAVGAVGAMDVAGAIARSQQYFRQTQYPDGYWWGELESNNTMEAEYIFLSWFLGKQNPEKWRKLTNYILSKQRDDGSWGQYYEAPGDLSTSVECYFALKLAAAHYGSTEAGRLPHHPSTESERPTLRQQAVAIEESEPLRKAREFILSKGGVPGCRVFTKIWLAIFGQWDWKGTPNLPPELMLLPSWAPFNIYEFSSWARPTVVPLMLVLTYRPVCQVPEGANIDELFLQPRSEVDYSLPHPYPNLLNLMNLFELKPSKDLLPFLLYHADQLVGLYRRFPIHPLRRTASQRAEEWVLAHQEYDGSWGGIQPPWVYSLIALHHQGYPVDHPVIERGFAGIEGFAIETEDTMTIQGCISPVWDTCLAQLALLESGISPDDPLVVKSGRWLMDRQILRPGDWQVRARNVQPGGWAFEFHNNLYPDIDDAAVVIMALLLSDLGDGETAKSEAVRRGIDWMTALQCKDGGWAAFDKDNNRHYLVDLPFSDFGETLDPPSADVTGHVLEMLGRSGYSRERPPPSGAKNRSDANLVEKGYQFLRGQQEADGSWFGRWGVNYIYGTAAVLPGLQAIGEDMSQPYVRQAVAWLVDHQNPDGGWGESCGSYVDPALRGVGPSTPSQTAWALLGLLAAEVDHPATRAGVAYLVATQQEDGTWDEPYFTGTGFPGYGVGALSPHLHKSGKVRRQDLDMASSFMIKYHLYRNYWPLLALGRYRRLAAAV